MSKDQIQIGQEQAYWNVSGTRILKYTVEMYHRGLNEHKLISAPEMDMLENKANLQVQKWTEKWGIIESKRRVVAENAYSSSNRPPIPFEIGHPFHVNPATDSI